jgi:hypothetical protein
MSLWTASMLKRDFLETPVGLITINFYLLASDEPV